MSYFFPAVLGIAFFGMDLSAPGMLEPVLSPNTFSLDLEVLSFLSTFCSHLRKLCDAIARGHHNQLPKWDDVREIRLAMLNMI